MELIECSESDGDSLLMSREASDDVDELSQNQDANLQTGIFKVAH